MTTYTKGMYLKDAGGAFCKVVAVVDEIAFLSPLWYKNDALLQTHQGLRNEDFASGYVTFKKLDTEYVIVSAVEAGFPKEKWVPKQDETYFFVTDTGGVDYSDWDDDDVDRFRAHTGNVFETKDLADAAVRKTKEEMK